MRNLMAPALAALALAACGGGSTADDAGGEGAVSIEEAARQAEAAGITPEPGQYRATMTMTGMDIPGMPAGMEGHGAGATTTTEYCLTEEEVAKGFEEMMKRGQNGECSYESFSLVGGKLDAVMVCKTAEGEARMTMNGTATPTSSDFTATMAMNVPELGEGTMSFAAKHERIGDCPAG